MPLDWGHLPIDWTKMPIDWTKWPADWPFMWDQKKEPEPPKKPVYSISSSSLNFSAAESYCKEKGEQLATVLNDEEWQSIKATVGRNGGWLGGFQAFKNAPWTWKSGWPWEFTAWNRNEPNNWGGREDCLEISRGGWNDISCSSRRKAICEKRAPIPVGFTPPPPKYQAYITRLTHDEAKAKCKQNGGNLASVTS